MNRKMKKAILLTAVLASVMTLFAFNMHNIFGVSSRYLSHPVEVKATIYRTNYGKTGVTANGTHIKGKDARKLKIIAVSPDMLKEWPLGTHVLVMGSDSLSGVYVVGDLMSKKFKKKIDILVNKDYHLCSYDHVVMFKVDENYFADSTKLRDYAISLNPKNKQTGSL